MPPQNQMVLYAKKECHELHHVWVSPDDYVEIMAALL